MVSSVHFPAHTLLWVSDITLAEQVPDWYEKHDAERPVVVRRAQHPAYIPVGIRGIGRSQRLAAWVDPKHITRSMSPQDVVKTQSWHQQYSHHALNQFLVLDNVDAIFQSFNLAWGLGGSIGFELATGLVTADDNSDLDIVINMDHAIEDHVLQQLWFELCQLDVAMDIQIEAPNGAFALREWLQRGSQPVMMKTPVAPVLTANPWS